MFMQLFYLSTLQMKERVCKQQSIVMDTARFSCQFHNSCQHQQVLGLLLLHLWK